jgi:uncharacterized membrane protein affecting hemolysin expression
MTLSESEFYPARRYHFTVACLFVLLLMLILAGLLSHRTLSYNRPVWKSSPYGELRDTGTVKAGH